MTRGRPATPRGTHGEVVVKQLNNGKFEADTRLRLHNGSTVRVRARGQSKTAAKRNLEQRCADRLGVTDTRTLHTTSPLTALLEDWYATKTDVKPQTLDRYRISIDNHISPALGNIRLNELTVQDLDVWLHAQTTGVAFTAKNVLSGALGNAVRYGLIPSNYMRDVRSIKAPKEEVRVLEIDQIAEFRADIKAYGNELISDVVDVSLSTGLRIGEILALRWQDIDLESTPPMLTVTGTVAYARGRGSFRQDEGKTATATRPIQLSGVATAVLQRRWENHGEYLEQVFPSGAGTYIWEGNFNRSFRKARGEKWDWVSNHALRKTLTTIVADSLSPRDAALLLGHSDSRMTEKVYIARNKQGVPIVDVVDGVLKMSK